jgi:23S rRNA (guanine745-N1)-methyltransferase
MGSAGEPRQPSAAATPPAGWIVPACTVRGCGAALRLEDRRAVCPRGHAFDRARAGFWNLLQPQDRRSQAPGDRREAALARRARVVSGDEAPFVAAMAGLLAAVPQATGTLVAPAHRAWLDVGCGEGALGAALHELLAARGQPWCRHGVDLSAPAIELAARAEPTGCFVVANADRGLPWPTGSFGLVSSINARLPWAELARVLVVGGRLLVAVPGTDDLAELRALLHGEATPLPGLARTLAAAPRLETLGLEELARRRVRFALRLDPAGVEQLLRGSYRGMRWRARQRLEQGLAEGMAAGTASDGGDGGEASRRAADRAPALVVTRDQELVVFGRVAGSSTAV